MILTGLTKQGTSIWSYIGSITQGIQGMVRWGQIFGADLNNFSD